MPYELATLGVIVFVLNASFTYSGSCSLDEESSIMAFLWQDYSDRIDRFDFANEFLDLRLCP